MLLGRPRVRSASSRRSVARRQNWVQFASKQVHTCTCREYLDGGACDFEIPELGTAVSPLARRSPRRSWWLAGAAVVERGRGLRSGAGASMDRLVAFSCKGRGFCPSCGGRRMAERAAHSANHVFPDVPVRQWALSLPYRLRYRLAWDHDLCRAVVAVSMRAVGWLRRRARLDEVADGRGGPWLSCSGSAGRSISTSMSTLSSWTASSHRTLRVRGRFIRRPALPPWTWPRCWRRWSRGSRACSSGGDSGIATTARVRRTRGRTRHQRWPGWLRCRAVRHPPAPEQGPEPHHNRRCQGVSLRCPAWAVSGGGVYTFR